MTVSLHPLVLLNIADHHIRHSQNSSTFFGVLMGEKNNPHWNVLSSFEIVLNEEDGIDYDYLTKRFEQNKIIYPTETLLGVYQIVNGVELELTDDLVGLRSILKELDQNGGGDGDLLSLVFSPKLSEKKHSNKKFLKFFDGERVELGYEIETKESEKVAIDTILELKESSNYSNYDKINDQLGDQTFVLKTLRNKLKLIATVLDDNKELKENETNDVGLYQNIRDINSFISKINYKQSQGIKKDLVDLETDLNLILNSGLVYKNVSNFERINSDIRRVEATINEFA